MASIRSEPESTPHSAEPPSVTVGLPVHNGGDHLCRALDSLLLQDHPSMEIVFRDNASTDGTEERCRAYAARDSRIRYLRNQSNIGALANFERVLGDARGKYFMWAAHDDRWSPDYLRRLVGALEQHPEAVLAAGRAAFVDQEGAPIPHAADSPAPAPTLDPWIALLRWHATHWIYGVFVRERLVERIPQLRAQRVWGGDMVWLMGLCTSCEMTGDDAAILYKMLKESPYRPSRPRDIAGWQLWYGRAIVREVLASPLPLRRKISAAGEAGRYWWKYVTNSGYAHLVLTWLRAARDFAGAGKDDGP